MPSEPLAVEGFEAGPGGALVVKLVFGLYEALEMLGGVWAHPDPLVTYVAAARGVDDARLTLESLAGEPRTAAAPSPDKVRTALEERLRPAPLYRVVFRFTAGEDDEEEAPLEAARCAVLGFMILGRRSSGVALAVALAAACGPPIPGTVVAVHDGDTVSVRREHDTLRVRLACIDAPEQGQAFGTRAKESWLKSALNRQVRLDVIDRDRYGRLVARLWADDLDVSLAMVERGMAWHYRHHCPDDHALAAAESDARQAKRGLWQERDRIRPGSGADADRPSHPARTSTAPTRQTNFAPRGVTRGVQSRARPSLGPDPPQKDQSRTRY